MMQENQHFNACPLLLSPRHHHKQIVLSFPRNLWDISSSHMVHTPISKPPFRPLQYMILSHSLFFQLAMFSYTGHKHILEVCILSANLSALMLCVSTNNRGVGVEPPIVYVLCISCFLQYPISFFYHLPLNLSFALSPSLLIYYSNEAEVRTWNK